MNGTNFLVPIDAKLETDRDVQFEALPLEQVMSAVEGAKKLRLILMDACRDNPFGRQMRRTIASRSIGRGLASIEPGREELSLPTRQSTERSRLMERGAIAHLLRRWSDTWERRVLRSINCSGLCAMTCLRPPIATGALRVWVAAWREFLFQAARNQMSSFLKALIWAITECGGRPGRWRWRASLCICVGW